MRLISAVAVTMILWGQSHAELLAHHSFSAEFSEASQITVRGVINRIEWVNPHSVIYMDVNQVDGPPERWKIEAGSPNVLSRLGLSREALQAGDEITIEGYRARDGSMFIGGRRLIFRDGRRVFIGLPASGELDPSRPIQHR